MKNQGIRSKNVTRQGVRTGAPRHKVDKGTVGQIGSSQGSHATTKGDTGYRGEAPLFRGPGTQSRLGNEIASSTQCGPGGSRTVYASGSQGGLKPAKPMPAGRNTLAEYGPDIKR
jgi:hypothetical protein